VVPTAAPPEAVPAGNGIIYNPGFGYVVPAATGITLLGALIVLIRFGAAGI
jgi:hypothetical protein